MNSGIQKRKPQKNLIKYFKMGLIDLFQKFKLKCKKVLRVSKLALIFLGLVASIGLYGFFLDVGCNILTRWVYGVETDVSYFETQENYQMQKNSEIDNILLTGGYTQKWLKYPLLIISFMVLILVTMI